VQLQSKIQGFFAAGINVFSLSYDEQDALADFRDAYDITYGLLSDPESKVIRQFGILNTLISEDDHPWFGIPFPGTYVVNSEGLISHKFFENNLQLRVGPEMLLRAAQGEMFEHSNTDREPPAETTWHVYLDGDRLAASVLNDLVARIEVPGGRHLYADPAPAGNVPVALILDEDPQIVTRDVVKPESESLTLGGTGEVIRVYEGAVELRLPVTVNADLGVAETEAREITLAGELQWQSCDDQVCDLPRRERFKLTIPLASIVVSELRASADGVLVRSMNSVKHFKGLSDRRQVPDGKESIKGGGDK
jgi:hypothetical protein